MILVASKKYLLPQKNAFTLFTKINSYAGTYGR